VPKKTTKKVTIPALAHTKAFAQLFHSAFTDSDILTKPTLTSETRNESALKYIGLWGSSKVNINTAPRHVLEAAFVFGGDAAIIAEEIIQLRRTKPFEDIEELRNKLFGYTDSIDKCRAYISTTSDFFTIRVEARSGTATATNIIAFKKANRGIEQIAVVSD